ncbi:MAG: tetratricopeptide repeat protein [Anaerolineales bacterium]|nr:tetratricopeptide repeat protein [Anaerolineales bacterium]
MDFQPGDFGENNPEDSIVNACPHCSKPVDKSATVCPHCHLPLDEIIQVDLSRELPNQRLHRLLQPRNILIAVLTVAVALGLYGFFVVQQLSGDYYTANGDSLIANGDIASAAEYYRQAVQLSPQDPEAYERLGWSEYQLAQDADAFKHFETALSLSSNRILSIYGAGVAAYRLRDYEKSISYLSRVVEVEPRHVEAYEYLGLAEYHLERYEIAYEHLNRAWIYNPRNPTVTYYLARVQAQGGETSLAIQNFNEAEKLGFDSGIIAYARGLTYLQAGEHESALIDLQKALLAYPTRKEVTLSLAKVLYLLKDYDAAQSQLAGIQADVPPDFQLEYLVLSGWVALRQGNTDTARDIFNRWLNLAPNNAQALNALGWAAYYAGDCQTASFYFESAAQSLQGEWVLSPDSLSSAQETPKDGLAAQCPAE